jgi:hypothetical protein
MARRLCKNYKNQIERNKMSQFISNKICAGEYQVRQKDDPFKRIVNISLLEFSDGPGWIASAQWVRDVYSDPHKRKYNAMNEAISMLKNWTIDGKFVEK